MTLLSAAILALSVRFLFYAKLQNGLLYGSYSYSNCNSTMGMRATVFFIAFCWIVFLFVGLKPFLNKQVFLLTRIGQNAWPIFLLHGFVVKATPIYWPRLVSSPVRVILTTCVILIFFGNQFINQFLYFISFMWLEKGKLNTLKEEKIWLCYLF